MSLTKELNQKLYNCIIGKSTTEIERRKVIERYRIMDNNDRISIYLNQDIDNPTYLFHGSPKILSKVNPQQSHDSMNNSENIATAVFLFPSFIKATPYAFKDTIKSNSSDLNYSFKISNDDTFPLMIMKNVNIDEDIIGYIYVFKKNEDMIKDNRSYQYKCYKELVPIDIVEVKYKDFKDYYEIKVDDKVSSIN